MENKPAIRFVFFGTSEHSVIALNTLKKAGLMPVLIVTTPDKPRGRGLALSPSPVKTWTLENNISLLQPEKLSGSEETQDFLNKLKAEHADVFIVMSYGKIIPESVISIPPRGILNIHPSLLPELRGATPIETAILEDKKETGVTIISIDKKMDHGPIVAQEKVTVMPWPPRASALGEELITAGAKLLAKILPDWIAGTLEAKPQDEAKATYTKKIEKADALIDISKPEHDHQNFLKIQAYAEWPRAYFMHTRKNGESIRVNITSAEYTDDKLKILKVIPEGRKEMTWDDFIRNF